MQAGSCNTFSWSPETLCRRSAWMRRQSRRRSEAGAYSRKSNP